MPEYRLGPLRVVAAPPLDPGLAAAHASFETSASAHLMDISPDGERIADDEGHTFEHVDTRAAFEVLVAQFLASALRVP